MKRALAALLLVACGSSPRASTPATPSGAPSSGSEPVANAEPGTYQDPDGVFQVKLGAQPDVDVKREPLGAGEIVTTTLSTSTDTRLAMAMKLVMSEVAAYDCAKGLAGMRDHTLANMGCTPTAEKAVELKGRPGREVLFSCTKRPMRGAMAIYCDDGALASQKRVTNYEVIAAYQERAYDEADAKALLASFQLR